MKQQLIYTKEMNSGIKKILANSTQVEVSSLILKLLEVKWEVLIKETTSI